MIRPGELLELGDVIECMCLNRQEIKFEIFSCEEFYNNETGEPISNRKYCRYYRITDTEISEGLDEKVEKLIFRGVDIIEVCCSTELYEFERIKISEEEAKEVIDEVWGSAVDYINAENNLLAIVLYNVRPSSMLKLYKMCDMVKPRVTKELDEEDDII